MTKVLLLAGGNIKNTPESLLFNEYQKRILWPVDVIEIKTKKDMSEAFYKNKKTTSCWIALDEKGEDLTSVAFSKFLENKMLNHQTIGFIIGVDVGIDDEIKKSCLHKIAFGAQTWPHLLVRVLFIEQLYRAQQIIQNHPYHKA